MNIPRSLLVFSAALLLVFLAAVLLAPAALADAIGPNTTTPLGPGFFLETSPATAGTPGLFEPCIFIGITGGGGMPTTQSLDLTNPMAGLLTSNLIPQPTPTSPQQFRIFLGMVVPPSTTPQFNFTLPTAIGTDGNYMWTATMGGTAGPPVSFTGDFQMSTPGGSITSWSLANPPDPDRGRSSFEIDFTVTPGANPPPIGDPAMTFTLTENLNGQNVPLDFTPVPEPATYALLAAGLLALAALRP